MGRGRRLYEEVRWEEGCAVHEGGPQEVVSQDGEGREAGVIVTTHDLILVDTILLVVILLLCVWRIR